MAASMILSLSIITSFEKKPEPQIHHLKCIGGTGEDGILYVIKLSDGNYLSCGYTDSQDGDFEARNGGLDAFLIKTNAAGILSGKRFMVVLVMMCFIISWKLLLVIYWPLVLPVQMIK
jgi:hypothetical protein